MKYMILAFALMLAACGKETVTNTVTNTVTAPACAASKLVGTWQIDANNTLNIANDCSYTQVTIDASTGAVQCNSSGLIADFTQGQTSGKMTADILASTCGTSADLKLYDILYSISGSTLSLSYQ